LIISFKELNYTQPFADFRPIHLFLIFEKSSLTNWIFNLQKSIWKWTFEGYTGNENPV
jgi:hypothetical protein